ncbi:ATP-binding protein [Rhodobacter flavimaris]|uniref:ATP-binding protein n=1 Tax=Rhodobacter flavimaris TaxID=2907145 RepID=UPI0034D5310C
MWAAPSSIRGRGGAAEELPHIFERFRSGSSSGGDSSGIGLWTTRRLAELQGGTIEVESWPGSGSVFTLWLRAGAPLEEGA